MPWDAGTCHRLSQQCHCFGWWRLFINAIENILFKSVRCHCLCQYFVFFAISRVKTKCHASRHNIWFMGSPCSDHSFAYYFIFLFSLLFSLIIYEICLPTKQFNAVSTANIVVIFHEPSHMDETRNDTNTLPDQKLSDNPSRSSYFSTQQLITRTHLKHLLL